MVSNGDRVRVNENGGTYIAEVLSTDDFEDPDGNQLFGIKVMDMIREPSYSLSEGETCNVYPSECSELED